METPINHEYPEELDMQKFRERPADACEGMQTKYIGMTYKEFLPSWEALKDHEGEVPEGYELVEETHSNPFTNEEKTIKVLALIPVKEPSEIIAEKIQELKLKLALGTITKIERDTLALLVK